MVENTVDRIVDGIHIGHSTVPINLKVWNVAHCAPYLLEDSAAVAGCISLFVGRTLK